MRPRRLGRLASRALAIALLIVPAILLEQILVEPALEQLRGVDDEIATAADDLDRIRGIAATAPGLQAMAARLTAEVGRSNAFVRADSEALAGAALQQYLSGLLASQQIAPSAMQWRALKGDNGPGQVFVRVQIATTLPPLYRLLRAIETGIPRLVVDDIDIQGQAAAVADPSDDVPLSVSIECAGYWLDTASRPAKAAP